MEVLWTMLKSMLKKVGFMTLAIPMLLVGMVTGASAEDPSEFDLNKTVIYECIAPLTNFEMPVNIKVPEIDFDKLQPNQSFTVYNAIAEVTLPDNPAVSTLRGFPYYANAISGDVTSFKIYSDNIASMIDVASTPIPIPVTPIPASGDLSFTVPQSGGISVGPFIAGPNGVVTITAGEINTTINPIGGLPLPINVTCTPKDIGDNAVLITIPIE